MFRPLRVTVCVLLALAACSSDSGSSGDEGLEEEEGPATTAAPADANFFLTISNQSFDRPLVLIEVTLDEKQVVAQVFDVEGQHNFVAFPFELTPGEHKLVARTPDGVATTSTFEMPAEGPYYGVLFFWTDPARGPFFDLQFMEEQPAFA